MTAIRGTSPAPEALTQRQREVLELLRRDYTNEQIAQRLGISLDGAKWHVSEIIGRLGVSDRHEAARWRAEGERRPSRAAWWSLAWLRDLHWAPAANAAALVVIIIVAIAVAALAWGVWRAATEDDEVAATSLGRSAEPPSDTLVARTAGGTIAVDTETGVVKEIISGLAATPLSISRDGTRIAFVCNPDLVPIQPNRTANNLCAFDAATSAVTMVVAASELPPGWTLTEEREATGGTWGDAATRGYAAWSPDGSKLAFQAYEPPYPDRYWDFTAAVYVKDLRSGKLRRVSDAPRPFRDSVSWSADGSGISVVEEAPDGDAAITWIRIVDTATGTSWTLPQREEAYTVVWSPDGSEIAINSELRLEIVSTVEHWYGYPAAFGGMYRSGDPVDWSPDGERILADEKLTARDGREWHRVDVGLGRPAVWSPDGKRIAFTDGFGDGDYTLYVTDLSGANAREVVSLDEVDTLHSIAWSGDGERLLYTATAGGGPARLMMVPLDGSAPARELFRHPVIDIPPVVP